MGFNSIFTYLTEYMFYSKAYCLPGVKSNLSMFSNKSAAFCINNFNISPIPFNNRY